ncbi:hypothetical protein POX78_21565 [Klebsiella michiganensis]
MSIAGTFTVASAVATFSATTSFTASEAGLSISNVSVVLAVWPRLSVMV